MSDRKFPESFIKALDYTFQNEGGFSNHKADRGGATMFGITRTTASRWLRRTVSIAEMKELSHEVAADIYFNWYWLPLSCDLITNVPVAIALFDIGVVRGPGVPPRYAQKTLNALGYRTIVDGHIGPKTVKGLNQVDALAFIQMYQHFVREGFKEIVKQRPAQGVFLKGWLNRAERLEKLV